MKYISGIRPSGRLHLGNYIGSILPALKYDADVLIAEYHAPYGNPYQLYAQLQKYFAEDKIKFQSKEFDAKLYFELLNQTATGLLKHMPQYKEKDQNALMFTYPVLMTHDIAKYDFVIVGEDQRPHIELAKDILTGHLYRKCPEPIYEGGKVMDLRHPERKMSKSTPESCLFLDDTYGEMQGKIKRAVTTPEGVANLEFIYKSLGGENKYELNSELKMAICALLETHLK